MHLFDNRHDFTFKSGVKLKSAESIQYLYQAMGNSVIHAEKTKQPTLAPVDT